MLRAAFRPTPTLMLALAGALACNGGGPQTAAVSQGCENQDPCTITISVQGNGLRYVAGNGPPGPRIQVAPDQDVEWATDPQDAVFTVLFPESRTPFRGPGNGVNRFGRGGGHQQRAGQIKSLSGKETFKFSVAFLRAGSGGQTDEIILEDPELIVDQF